jgi:hypothetical protein
MDLNLKYSDHQKAILKAGSAPDAVMRGLHLDRAAVIAEEIAVFQLKLGAAASCAWSALKMGPPQLWASTSAGQAL